MCKILVVSQDEDSAAELLLLMTLLGHEASIARDGREAIACATQAPPHIVVVDLDASTAGGRRAARAMVHDRDDDSPFVIALTRVLDDEVVRDASDSGFACCLESPPELELLIPLVNDLAQRRRG